MRPVTVSHFPSLAFLFERMKPNTRECLTQEALRGVVHYESKTGKMTWAIGFLGKVQKGREVGNLTPNGYRIAKVFGFNYLVHRLAWLYVYGRFPDGLIDHINGDKLDNRIENLREATKAENAWNSAISTNAQGVKGLRFDKRRKRWSGCVLANRQYHFTPSSKDRSEVVEWVTKLREKLHGEFTNHGFGVGRNKQSNCGHEASASGGYKTGSP